MPTVDGIVSGIDTTRLIEAIVTSRQVAIDGLKFQQENFERQREAVAGVKNRMSSISSAIAEIDTTTELRAFKASTASTAFSVTASNGATPGSYPLRVVQLARAELSASQGYADKTSAVVNTGTMQVTVGGVTTNVTIDASSQSLEGLAKKIGEVAGVDAYVLDTGVAGSRYRLMVAGTRTGAANAIDVNFAGVGGGPVLTEQATAVEARVEIGGVTVYASSNTLDGSVPGVRIELKAETAAAEDFTVELDKQATRERVQKVVDAYNEAITYYNTQNVFDSAKGLRGPLVGESSTRRAIDDIGQIVSSPFTVAGTTLRGLSELGVATQRDGSLKFDTAAFEARYAADPDGVDAFLTSSSGPLAKLRSKIDDSIVDADTGTLVSRGETLDSTIADLEERIFAAEERLASESERLRAQFTAMETMLAKIQSSAASLSALLAGLGTSSSQK